MQHLSLKWTHVYFTPSGSDRLLQIGFNSIKKFPLDWVNMFRKQVSSPTGTQLVFSVIFGIRAIKKNTFEIVKLFARSNNKRAK